jgi:hypothetical protein
MVGIENRYCGKETRTERRRVASLSPDEGRRDSNEPSLERENVSTHTSQIFVDPIIARSGSCDEAIPNLVITLFETKIASPKSGSQ